MRDYTLEQLRKTERLAEVIGAQREKQDILVLVTNAFVSGIEAGTRLVRKVEN